MFYYKHILNFQNSRKTNLLTRFDGFDKRLNSMILQQVPQPVPQSTNTAKQVKNHLGRKSQGIQKRQPIKRFHMKKSFVAQNSPLFH
ncbi:unnamed protein product [Rhizophagus irregularis]|nr:unnamed protein product [Rhizophagus irregularis]